MEKNQFRIKYNGLFDSYSLIFLKYIPKTISPNMLTLLNLVICFGIWLLTEYIVSLPIIIICYFIILILNRLDGAQARLINNNTALGELFNHIVAIVELFVIIRISTIVFNIEDQYLLPLYIVIGWIFSWTHYRAYAYGYLSFPKYISPNQLILLIIIAYLTKPWIVWRYIFSYEKFQLLTIIFCIADICYLCYKRNLSMMRYGFILLFSIWLSNYWYVSYFQIFCIFILINADLITAKMAKSTMRKYLWTDCLICLSHDSLAFATTLSILYDMFSEIKNALHIPWLQTFRISEPIKMKYPKYYITENTYNDLQFSAEQDTGFIEYKRTLVNCVKTQADKYATQMQWRISQNGKTKCATYYIGIDDDGTIVGLSCPEIMECIECFVYIAESISASIIGIHIIHIGNKSILKMVVKIKKIKNNYLVDFDKDI